MAGSSTDDEFRSFFTYYQAYAQTGIHAASAAATTILGLLATIVNPWFLVPAIAVYVLPLLFLYLTGEGDRVPSVVGNENHDGGATDTDDERESKRSDRSAVETDRHRTDSDSTGNSAPTTDSATAETESADEKRDSDTTDTEPGWSEIDTPTDQSLLDVVATHNGAYAVGEGGVVLARDGGDWGVILERGPTAESNALFGVDATADDKIVWFAGDSGVLGRYDGEQLTDHSAPKDQTGTWTDIAVTGETGEERIHLVNGSGEVLRGEYGNGSVSWNDIEKPGGGSSISAIAFANSDFGYVCDTNQSVYETTDGGEKYENIGIEDANTDFNGVAATDSTVVVAGGDGSVFRYDGSVWTRLHAGSELSAIGLRGETGLAAGDDGAVYELIDSWESVETPVDADLHGVAISADDSEQARPDVAVGTDGTVIERCGE